VIPSISPNRQGQKPSFGRALSEKELKHFREVYAQSQKALNKSLGIEKDAKVFIMPDFSMPDIDHENTGMGRLFSDGTPKFAKLVKDYFQADAIQVLPQNKNFGIKTNHFSPYSCEASALGEHTINLKALTTKEFGEILTKQEFNNFANKNQRKDFVNVENEIGIRKNINPRLELLKTAFERFKKNDTLELNKLHQEFNTYKNDPAEAQRMERISLYDILQPHHHDLFAETFDKPLREEIIKKAKEEHSDEIEFFKFWQFLADNHHQKGRDLLKKQGIELIGDCPASFSKADKWSCPEGLTGHDEWGFPKIDPDRLYKQDGSLDVGGEKLKEKLVFFLTRYDGIRFDVGRKYAEHGSDNILKFIEKTAKEIKGPEFDLSKLSYEEGHGHYFQNRTKIYQDFSLNSSQNELAQVGLGNHDNFQRGCAITEAKKISPNDSQEIVKSKFGKLLTYPKKFIFFNDFLGKEKVFNYENTDNPNSFRHKLSPKYEEEYHKALQNGDGFNLMESLAIAMKHQGLEKTDKTLYEEVLKQSKILRESGAVTQAEADKIEQNKGSKNIFKKIAIATVAVAAIITSAILLKNKKPQQQPQTQEKYSLNPQYQYLRTNQSPKNPLI